MSLAGILGIGVIIVNVVVMILGLVILILGALVTWSQSFVYNLIAPSLNIVSNIFPSANTAVNGPQSAAYILELIKNVGFPVFIMGCIVVGVAICGIVGVCCSLRLLLIAYIAATFCITVAILIFTVVIYSNSTVTDNIAQPYLKEILKGFSNEVNATNAQTVFMVLLQSQLGCCGISNGDDYYSVSSWERNVTYNGANYYLQYPISCCLYMPGSFTPYYPDCPGQFNSNNSYYNLGCYSKARQLIQSYSLIGAGILVAIIIILILLMIISATIMGEAKIGPL